MSLVALLLLIIYGTLRRLATLNNCMDYFSQMRIELKENLLQLAISSQKYHEDNNKIQTYIILDF